MSKLENNEEPITAEQALVVLAKILRAEAFRASKDKFLREDLLQEMALAVVLRGDGRRLETYLAAARRRMFQVLKRLGKGDC